MKGNAVTHAYRQLGRHLIDGDILPGERLNESALSRQLEVSRTPLREALNRLVGEGVVDQRAGSGFARSQPDPAEAEALRTTRHALLTIALHQACAPDHVPVLRRVIRGWIAEDHRARPIPAVRLWQRRLLRAAAVSGNGALVRQIHRLNRRLAGDDAARLLRDESLARLPVAVMMALIWARPESIDATLAPLCGARPGRKPMIT